MPISPAALDAAARLYTAPMTPIRGRRVHRLLLRAFAGLDHVLQAVAEDGSPALLAWADSGEVALCHSDGRGAAAAVHRWARLPGAAVSTHHDLLKDSLPVLHWTVWHPGFARAAGALTLSAAELSVPEQQQRAVALRRLGA